MQRVLGLVIAVKTGIEIVIGIQIEYHLKWNTDDADVADNHGFVV